MWSKETLDDADLVYMRVHKSLSFGSEIRPNFFRDHEGGMSVDWNKYSTPEQTRERARVPEDNGVVRINVGQVRAISGLLVEHEPVQEGMLDEGGNSIPANRSHSEVIGDKSTERRLLLSRIAQWEIRVG